MFDSLIEAVEYRDLYIIINNKNGMLNFPDKHQIFFKKVKTLT